MRTTISPQTRQHKHLWQMFIDFIYSFIYSLPSSSVIISTTYGGLKSRELVLEEKEEVILLEQTSTVVSGNYNKYIAFLFSLTENKNPN